MPNIVIEKNYYDKIVDLYLSGKTQKEIAKEFNCSQNTISNILKRKQVKCRSKKDVFLNKKYNDINHNFFKKIKCEESAYYLGFLYADGCVQIKNNQYVVSLKLKKDDQIILEKFKNIMSPSSTIKLINNKYSLIRINQKEICNQLIEHGCLPNKSLILKFPETVPNHLLKHFIRGYSDGDGTIYKNIFKNKKYINTIWKIVSTKEFCDKTSNLLKKELQINCSQSLSSPAKNKITTTLTVGGNKQVKKILDWLYEDATIYLPRKYDKYIEFKNYLNEKEQL